MHSTINSTTQVRAFLLQQPSVIKPRLKHYDEWLLQHSNSYWPWYQYHCLTIGSLMNLLMTVISALSPGGTKLYFLGKTKVFPSQPSSPIESMLELHLSVQHPSATHSPQPLLRANKSSLPQLDYACVLSQGQPFHTVPETSIIISFTPHNGGA